MKTVALLCLAVLTSAAFAQAPKAPVKKERKPSPALAQVQDEPGLPRVLIIGDSISIGYTLDVRALLKGKANVHRIPTNGGPTTNGLKNIQAWLGDGKWDVIHFNWGLHDLKYIQDDPSKRADPKAPGSHQQVALADYEKNLATLVKTMQATGAKLICGDGTAARAEVVGFRGNKAVLVPLDVDAPLENGVRVEPDSAANQVQVGEGLIGRIIDAILTNTVLPTISIEYLKRLAAGGAIHRVALDVANSDFTYAFD